MCSAPKRFGKTLKVSDITALFLDKLIPVSTTELPNLQVNVEVGLYELINSLSIVLLVGPLRNTSSKSSNGSRAAKLHILQNVLHRTLLLQSFTAHQRFAVHLLKDYGPVILPLLCTDAIFLKAIIRLLWFMNISGEDDWHRKWHWSDTKACDMRVRWNRNFT